MTTQPDDVIFLLALLTTVLVVVLTVALQRLCELARWRRVAQARLDKAWEMLIAHNDTLRVLEQTVFEEPWVPDDDAGQAFDGLLAAHYSSSGARVEPPEADEQEEGDAGDGRAQRRPRP